MLVRYFILSPCVRPSIRLSQAGILSKRLDESSECLEHGGFLPPIPHWVIRKCVYLLKLGYFPLELCPKLRTNKISPRQVDRVVNKTRRRRRRRSSLLTTPIQQSTSRGCLLQTDQMWPSNFTPFVVDLSYNLFLQLTRFWLTQRVERSLCGSGISCPY